MNWLAHAFLSPADDEVRLGNLLADMVKRDQRASLGRAFEFGTQCHQAIDAFTDTHPIFHRSCKRIGESHRRYATILVDIFYDHFLARRWNDYCVEPLEQFNAKFYAAATGHALALPESAAGALEHIVQTDRFGAYRTVEGIEDTLARLGRRLTARFGRPVELAKATNDLQSKAALFEADFAAFFPQLQSHVQAWTESRVHLLNEISEARC